MVDSPSDIKSEVVGGRYKLGEVIGRGGMASVYNARDENLGRDVALKLFAPQAPDAEELKRQEAEISLLATLNHPGLVTLFDAGIDTRIPDEPRPFLTMELIEGEDLRTRIRQGPVPLDELAIIGAGIADALAYVHGMGIIHRDIKPANILLVSVRPGEPVRPKLTDFGIARIVDGTRLTATGTMVGTAAYLSPEQAKGEVMGPPSDIYSLGLVLLESIKGTVEYPGSAVESAVARLHRAPEIPEDLPQEWADLIRAMTALDPLARPTAADIEVALRPAAVSPDSVPGQLVEEHTRMLPAVPAQAPLSLPGDAQEGGSEFALDVPRRNGRGDVEDLGIVRDRVQPLRRQKSRKLRSRKQQLRRRGRIIMAAVIVVLLAVAAVVLSLSIPKAPADIPYPTVTGTLGEHLEQLQKSVQP